MTSWTATLDLLERQLRRQENALRKGADPPEIIVLDEPDGHMTDGEQVRAIALMQRNDAMIVEALTQMKRARRKNATPYSR